MNEFRGNTQYALAYKGQTRYYATQQEAESMARMCGLPVSAVMVVSLY